LTHLLATHEKLCQIPYKILQCCPTTMVARQMSQTLGTYALKFRVSLFEVDFRQLPNVNKLQDPSRFLDELDKQTIMFCS
jgi:hypothetical protein